MGEENGYKRWGDKMLGWSVVVVGALSAILWGILWSTVSASQERIGKMEGKDGVIEERLRSMNEKLDRIEEGLRRKP